MGVDCVVLEPNNPKVHQAVVEEQKRRIA